ncbi:cilia- and flagella-associated protein 418 [Scleropages formosus]|uniref:Cilia- and flagella-associated protein 418 n=1 Tax=Scleropages formosus TaxID=113540 RepID=A0A8C9SSC5_SCLFO|nr:protein C8orf37 homolog [Scleropages formosus]
MADDLDELLDEVESKFCRGFPATGPRFPAGDGNRDGNRDGGRPSKSDQEPEGRCGAERTKKAVPGEGDDAEDIDALLEDILDDDYDCDALNLDMSKAAKKDHKSSSLPPANTKCCPVFLGGTSVAFGVGTRTSQRACDQLRCTSCDFRVATFDDCEWDPSCDYLFFRNNMPSCEKLRAKLKRRRGMRAYACQCSWCSVVALGDVSQQPQLKWVCGKHEA